MKFNILLLLSFSCLTVCAQVNAGSGKPQLKSDTLTFDSLAHKTVFTFNGKGFTGKGWEVLKQEIQKSHFVLIGEQHGEAEVPLFTDMVSEVLKPKALVVEIDPFTAAELQKVSDEKRYKTVLKENPYAFAFYSWHQEMDLVGKIRSSGGEIWGLNEINFLSMGTFFQNLAANAKLPANKKVAAQLAAQYIKNDTPLYTSGEFGKFAAFNMKESLVDSLIVNFKDESALCRKMLGDLKISVPIFANTSYTQRTNLMKKNLLNYVYKGIGADQVEMPKLLFKFGANHVTRTNDLKGAFEVGNLADQLAGAAGKKALHILIFGKAGTINNMTVANNSKAVVPYTVAEDPDLKTLTQFTNPVMNDEWAVYDLRPMRKAINEGKYHPAGGNFKALVMGYDLLVTFAKTTGSTFFE